MIVVMRKNIKKSGGDVEKSRVAFLNQDAGEEYFSLSRLGSRLFCGE